MLRVKLSGTLYDGWILAFGVLGKLLHGLRRDLLCLLWTYRSSTEQAR
jgi:hypothetical protein